MKSSALLLILSVYLLSNVFGQFEQSSILENQKFQDEHYEIENWRDDAINTKDSIHEYYMNDVGQQMELIRKYYYAYNNQVSEISQLSLVQYETSGWNNYEKYLKQYDEQNRIAEDLLLHYNVDAAEWELFEKDMYSYGIDGDTVLTLLFDSNNGWNPVSKNVNEYDQNGYLSSAKQYLWKEGDDLWMIYTTYLYEYDDQGREITKERIVNDETMTHTIDSTFYSSDGTLVTLINRSLFDAYPYSALSHKRINEYDELGNRLLFESYNFSEEAWELSHRHTYYYNDDSYPTEALWQIRSSETGEMTNNRLYNYEYSADYNERKITFSTWSADEAWNDYKEHYYYYSDKYVGVNQNVKAKVNVYPNPVTDMIFIKLPNEYMSYKGKCTIRLCNVSGMVVLQQSFMPDHAVDLSGFSSGIYFVNISIGEQNFTQKILLD